MNMLFVLIPLAIVLLGVAIGAFFWAVRSGQFDDLDTPAHRMLEDDEATKPKRVRPVRASAKTPLEATLRELSPDEIKQRLQAQKDADKKRKEAAAALKLTSQDALKLGMTQKQPGRGRVASLTGHEFPDQ